MRVLAKTHADYVLCLFTDFLFNKKGKFGSHLNYIVGRIFMKKASCKVSILTSAHSVCHCKFMIAKVQKFESSFITFLPFVFVLKL